MPAINRRIRSLLQEDTYKEEFGHTLLHNHNLFEEYKKKKDKLKAQVSL